MLRRTAPRAVWGYKSEVAITSYSRPWAYTFKDASTRRLGDDAFDYDNVVKEAIAAVDINRNRMASVPDERWWRKLCKALQERPRSNYGARLLHNRVVRALSSRLILEEHWHNFKAEIEKEIVADPIFVVGLPRSGGTMATHIYGRSGYVQPLRVCDTTYPGVINERERISMTKETLRNHFWMNHPMQTVRACIDAEYMDDDIQLHLHTPYSIAWGLMHNMPDYLYESLQEDQGPVFEHLKRTLQTFQWYRRCGHFPDYVKREVTEIDNAQNHVADGRKDNLGYLPFIVHSPLSILTMQRLHESFPDMRVIWCHRGLEGCVSSLCSCLCWHDTQYTGHRPSEAARSTIGEMVVGLFGSGSEQSIDYMSDFSFERMVHWHNLDLQRSGVRLFEKTNDGWLGNTDIFRKKQAINGMVEFQQQFKPHHDATLDMFSLHEGILNEQFRAYIFQFEEYAFEKKFPLEIQDYQPMAETIDTSVMGLLDQAQSERTTSMHGMPVAGHLLQVPRAFKPQGYAVTPPKPSKQVIVR